VAKANDLTSQILSESLKSEKTVKSRKTEKIDQNEDFFKFSNLKE